VKIRIKNYVGAARAELEIVNGITLIGGDNAQGKSSVLRGIASLVTGEIVPDGVNKGDSAVLVMDGAKAGEVILTTDDSAATITYPDPKFVTQGEPPQASRIAAGLVNFTALKPQERARLLQELLEAMPTPDAVREGLKDHMTEADIDLVLGMIEKEGYDGTVERLREKRVKMKGRWEDITGQRWGDQKALSWMPEGWSEYDEQPQEQISARLATCQEAYDRVARQSVIETGEYQALVDLLGKREPTEMALDVAKKQLPSIETDWARLRREMETLPSPVEEGIPCPHCGAHVVVSRGTGTDAVRLLAVEPMLEGEPERRRRAIEEKRGQVGEAYRKLEQQQGLIGACQEKLREIARAQEKLKGVKQGEARDPQVVEKALAQLERAKASAARVKLARDADNAAETVRIYTIIIDLLAPDGLRKRVLNTKLGMFEVSYLATLVKDAPTWRPVTIDRDTLMPRYGGRPYVLCSRSEQWRTNVLLQIAIALLEGAAIVCIDGADILSQEGQDDFLLGVLAGLPFPVVVGAMYSREKSVPDLARANLGVSYWMKNGTLGTMTSP
jgi:hypothetical protein